MAGRPQGPGAGERARDYLRWRRPAGAPPPTTQQLVTSAVFAGLVFAVLSSVWDGLTDGWDEVTVTSFLFSAVFFGLLMFLFSFVMRRRTSGGI